MFDIRKSLESTGWFSTEDLATQNTEINLIIDAIKSGTTRNFKLVDNTGAIYRIWVGVINAVAGMTVGKECRHWSEGESYTWSTDGQLCRKITTKNVGPYTEHTLTIYSKPELSNSKTNTTTVCWLKDGVVHHDSEHAVVVTNTDTGKLVHRYYYIEGKRVSTKIFKDTYDGQIIHIRTIGGIS